MPGQSRHSWVGQEGSVAFGVFIHRADSIYDDSPAERYQFPGQYLSRATQCVGDWIVYYEPRKVTGSRGYYAVARVAQIVPDPTANDMHLALIEPGSYLEFATPVPFQLNGGVAETGLLNELGRISGRAQAAVRTMSAADFRRIVNFGLQDTEVMPRLDEPRTAPVPGLADQPQADFVFEVERERVTGLSSRLLRDRVFRRVVLNAYGERCAVTGLKLINGGGRAEVEAAHIRPVEHNGPDIVNNGIALSGTVHWMFDRGLLGFSDTLDIEVSRHVNDVEGIRTLINPTGRLIGPQESRDRPHPAFLRWHREHCFKH